MTISAASGGRTMNRRHLADCALAAASLLVGACSAGSGGSSLVGVQISPASAEVAAGRDQPFRALAVYSDGRKDDVTASVQWSSSLPSIASIGPDGAARSHHQGQTRIAAQLNSFSGAAPLTVTAPVVDHIRVEPADRWLSTSSSTQYDAYAVYSDGSERKVTAAATWSSSNGAVATVSASGQVTGANDGTTQIVAAYGGTQGQTGVTVVPSVLYGGGDMLAALAYVGTSWFDASSPESSRRLSGPSNPPDPGSIFGAFSAQSQSQGAPNPLVSYCQTGDAVGKHVYDGFDGGRADALCGDYSAPPRGFSGVLHSTTTTAGPITTTTTNPDFAAVELPLTGDELLSLSNNRQTAPVQIPVLAASIAIAYNNPAISGQINLTSDDLCGIFFGQYTFWDQLSFWGGAPAPQNRKPIVVVYRGDSSAATFALMNHLSFVQTSKGSGRACPFLETSGGSDAAENPRNQTGGFRAVPFFTDALVPSQLPANALSAGSDAELGNLVSTTDGAIGYGEAADLRLRFCGPGDQRAFCASRPVLSFATVNGFDPLTGLQPPLVQVYRGCAISGTGPVSVFFDAAVSDSPGCETSEGESPNRIAIISTSTPATKAMVFTAGRPVTLDTSGGEACQVLVEPMSYADLSNPTTCADGMCVGNSNRPKGYPIVSVSYLVAYTSGNGTAAPAIQRLLQAPYSGAATLPQGFTTIAGWSPSDDFVNNCVGP
jgi:phosphate transport system substrate-binding protein